MISNNKIISLVDKLYYKLKIYSYTPDLIISIGVDNVYAALKLRDKIDINLDVENINFKLNEPTFVHINKSYIEDKKILFVIQTTDLDTINQTINYIRNECNIIDNLSLCVLINNIDYNFQLDDRFDFYYAIRKH